jgi:HPt (histidine-containing phosphotransfer) domain-containing protein
MNGESCLDTAVIEKLMQIGGRDFVTQMIDLFLSYVPQKLMEARAAGQAGDLGGVQKAVHPIKSSAGHVGALLMRDLALRIEELARDQRGESIAGLLAELEAAYAQVKARLEQQRETLVSGERKGSDE